MNEIKQSQLIKYLNKSDVRKLANKHNRRAGKDFLVMLDAMIERKPA